MEPCSAARVYLLVLVAVSVISGSVASSDFGSGSAESGFQVIGDVRLVGGRNEREGRVEVYRNGSWGTICDDQWDNSDAEVICRQLGLWKDGQPVHAVKESGSVFELGLEDIDSLPIHLDDVKCRGSEQSLLECGYVETHDCTHAQDAGVLCPGNCVNGEIRLVGGRTEFDGRVEVCNRGIWGTICDDSVDSTEATVMCYQLGMHDRHIQPIAAGEAFFGEGLGPISLNELSCSGKEHNLSMCNFDQNSRKKCKHSEDVGVFCRGGRDNCSDGDIRLVGEGKEREGVVQVCYNRVWGSVCGKRQDWMFNDATARVVCNQLGFLASDKVTASHLNEDTVRGPIILSDVECKGSEERLIKCPHPGPGKHSCYNSMSAEYYVVCPTNCSDYDVRLVDGRNRNEGIVESCFKGHWLPICSGQWSDNEAIVVCQQLGLSTFDSSAAAVSSNAFGYVPLFKVSLSLHCEDSEANIYKCNPTVVFQGCQHGGVYCKVNCSDEMTLTALTKEGKMDDVCGQYNLSTDDLETKSGGLQLGILAAAITVPLVAIFTAMVAILLLLVTVLCRKRSRATVTMQSCPSSFPHWEGNDSGKTPEHHQLMLSKLSRSGPEQPQLLETPFLHPEASLPHTYESLRGHQNWAILPKQSMFEELSDEASSNITGSDTKYQYAVLESTAAPALQLQPNNEANLLPNPLKQMDGRETDCLKISTRTGDIYQGFPNATSEKENFHSHNDSESSTSHLTSNIVETCVAEVREPKPSTYDHLQSFNPLADSTTNGLCSDGRDFEETHKT